MVSQASRSTAAALGQLGQLARRAGQRRQQQVQVRLYSAASADTIPPSKRKYVPSSGTYPRGFRASGIIVGVKPGNTTKPDLALLASDVPCAAAAVFTKNRFQAAPVTFSRDLLRRKGNAGVAGVIVNSGDRKSVV